MYSTRQDGYRKGNKMHFDQDGTYNLVYIAEDECGNKTLAERVVEVATYRTVLYPDGTFIINEKSTNQASNESKHGGTATNVYIPFDPNGATDMDKYIFADGSYRPWNSQKASVLRTEIGSKIAPTDTKYWFADFTKCTSMDLSLLDTSNTTNMHRMFIDCYVLTALDVSHFDTSKVTDMGGMFVWCKALTTLDVSRFDTSEVTDMSSMFSRCNALTELDVSHFDTSKVTNVSQMFYICSALTELDVSHFDTSNVTDIHSMFAGCNLVTALDVSNFDTSKVSNMSNMFSGCNSISHLDLSNFDTSLVTDMASMFYSCKQLSTIYASAKFVVGQVTSSGSMFQNMSTNLVGGAGTTWASSNRYDKTYAHIDGGTSNPGYFTAKA